MIPFLSLVTSVKDYIEIVHKLVETNPTSPFEFNNYSDFGAILTYIIVGSKDFFTSIVTFKWLQNLSALPLRVPDIASAMLSEISVLDGYFHNSFTFLETPLSYGNQNFIFYGIEKFMIGFINSVFLCLPTSTSHIITLRRFVMQGLEAGYFAGLGTLVGNIVWIGSILFGLRFVIIPWLSFDVLRYGLGFLLIVKYMWDSYSERRTALENVSKWKIFLLNFLLAFTEQATIYPFLSNLSIGSDATVLESFPTNSFFEYSIVHFCYLGGLVIGGLTLLQFTCWFWENPAFNIYMWALSSFKITTPFSQKFVNVLFLYLTMFFTISNVSYFGFDYTLTNPLGFVHEDRLMDQKNLIETSFLNSKSSDRNTRRNRGRHGRRERWKRRVRRYRTFDASLYDQGVYDLFTIEDLNYGFDRFWLRRKLRNHRVRFRFFPGPWMRSFKKQLARPRLESFMGPRVEFFRILFEQAYHPEFHEFRNVPVNLKKQNEQLRSQPLNSNSSLIAFKDFNANNLISFYSEKNEKIPVKNLFKEYSALRKFVRKAKTRTNIGEILSDMNSKNFNKNTSFNFQNTTGTKSIYSKRWKQIFSKISHNTTRSGSSANFQEREIANFYRQALQDPSNSKNLKTYFKDWPAVSNLEKNRSNLTVKQNSEKQFLKKDRQILRYKTFLNQNAQPKTRTQESKAFDTSNFDIYKPLVLFHPLRFYLQKEQAFQKKMRFYGASLFRNFGIENNAPYYRIMMKKFFYYYKPTLRWERTLRTATMRKARRKGPRVPRKLNVNKTTQMLAESGFSNLQENPFLSKQPLNTELSVNRLPTAKTKIQKPTHFYSLVSKRATRYRYQIYKDVLQHWYYSPFNRLFLKFDVDSFIRRQPKAHFLTKKEENLLHLKRFLLSDYYNTLRWYNYMEHYNTMKKSIGKSKSFANGSYNQQFFGTFKKIRHLFAITPSLSQSTVLKFDQPLFNEYSNNEKTKNKNYSFYTSDFIHEELLADAQIYSNFESRQTLPQDFANQSTTLLKNYLEKAEPIRQEYIAKLINDKNYTELTNFFFKGQKIRGEKPITNQTSFLNQEKNYLLNPDRQKSERQTVSTFFNEKLFDSDFEDSLKTQNVDRTLWISLMKKCRNMLYNQEALKFYVSARVDKLEKQKKREEKFFKTRLENMKNWTALETLGFQEKNLKKQMETTHQTGLTSSLQKAIKEGLFSQISSSNKKLEKSNLRNNRPKILLNLPLKKSQHFTRVSLNLKNHLNEKIKKRALQTLETEKRLKTNLLSVKNQMTKTNSTTTLTNVNPALITKRIQQTLLPFRFVSRSISNKLKTMKTREPTKMIFKPFQILWNWLTPTPEKNLKNWKNKETVFSTRKKIRRKIYRVLDQKKAVTKRSNRNEIERFNQFENLQNLRQKQDALETNEIQRQKQRWNVYETEKSVFSQTVNTNQEKLLKADRKKLSRKTFSEIFEKNFKKKRTRSRRYRRFKGRGPIKKHTLAEKLKRQFKLLKRYGQKQEGKDKKMEIFQMITKRNYRPESLFERRDLKQRRTRQTKHRFWKKHKRQKYLQLKRKQRKRRRYAISKLRVLNKEIKHIKNQVQLKQWWWQEFLQSFMTTTNAIWQVDKDQQVQDQLEKSSVFEVFKRDRTSNTNSIAMLQIGNQDFKPLALPEANLLRTDLIENGRLNFTTDSRPQKNLDSGRSITKHQNDVKSTQNFEETANSNTIETAQNQTGLFQNLTTTLFEPQNTRIPNLTQNLDSKKFLGLNPIPFYAGWDETTRQFVVTNRFLSRKEAGYTMNLTTNDANLKIANESLPQNLQILESNVKEGKINFTKAPLEGMNAATTLYWQIPFTTYDPDQFFALGMDGFSPLAWRFFNFKHSKQTTKPLLIHNVFSRSQTQLQKQSLLSYNLQMKIFQTNSSSTSKSLFWNSNLNSPSNKVSKNQARKIQKRQKRVKKHPRAPVWFPSGPFANQILPVHYIYVFYKRSRLPRDRYIGRRFRRIND